MTGNCLKCHFSFFFQVDLDDESFNVLIDRGELDRLHKDRSSCQRTDSNIIEYFEIVQRILKVGGRFISFSFATEDILDKLLHYFSSGWFFRVHLVNTERSGGKSVSLPLFCFVLTKTKFAGQCFYSLSHRCSLGSSCFPSFIWGGNG